MSETIKEPKKKKGRRDWVKNAVIVFLAVLLVLTFFSNTIMNHSLPEVAAQYPQSTTIVTKIRGSGTVAAAQTYNVSIQESRKVASLNVKAGDEVKAGDVLLTLDEMDSQELTEAREALRTQELELEKLKVPTGDQTHADAASLQQLRNAVTAAEKTLSDAQTYASYYNWYQQQVADAQSAVSSAQSYQADLATELSLLQNEKENLTATNQSYIDADWRVTQAQNRVDRLTASEPAFSDTAVLPSPSPAEAGAPEDSSGETGTETEEPAVPAVQESQVHKDWQADLDDAKLELLNATADRNAILSSLTLDVDQRIASMNVYKINADAAVTDAQSSLEQANSALTKFQSDYPSPGTVDAATAALQTAREALSAAEAAAADKQAQQSHDATLAQMELAAKEQALEEARDRVKALEEKAAASEIVSRYAGVVQAVNVTAGDTTSPETPMVVIELTERGYTLSATVTREQARLLREGMTAEITNLWNTDIEMTLSAIQTDKANPNAGRTLLFTVKGEDVTVGQQLSFSIGDRNASYDVVVPSSAVHQDSDGSFVYTVGVKSSPLGNRYTVRRTKVEVIASDDTRTAVSGELTTSDFVITTSTVYLKVGDQVRIAE